MKMIFDPTMLSALSGADSFMVCTHVRPDGDAIGSLLATGRLLRALGKQVTLLCQDPVPEKYYNFFDDAKTVMTPDQAAEMHFDAAMAVDVASADRMGSALEVFQRAPVTMQIDHHAGNEGYAMYNAVDENASAAGELVVQFYDALQIAIDPVAAAQLYVAISTDCGNFTFSSVRAETFAAMQRLMESGLDIADINRRLFKDRKVQQVKMLSSALGTLEFVADGQATCMFVTQENLRAANAGSEHLNGIVNAGLDIEGVKITFMGDELPDGGWKISLRAKPGYHVNDIAAKFGGGGHHLAAGCTIKAPWEEVKALLIAEIKAQIGA